MYFQGFPGTPQVESTTPVEGNVSFQLGSKKANLEHSGCQNTSYKALSCKLTGSERILSCNLTGSERIRNDSKL